MKSMAVIEKLSLWLNDYYSILDDVRTGCSVNNVRSFLYAIQLRKWKNNYEE